MGLLVGQVIVTVAEMMAKTEATAMAPAMVMDLQMATAMDRVLGMGIVSMLKSMYPE